MRKRKVMRMNELRTLGEVALNHLEERRPSGEAGINHLIETARLVRRLSEELERKVGSEVTAYKTNGPRAYGTAHQVPSCVPKPPPQRYRHFER
jgi:HD superfamily phosphodiesterase